MSLTTEFAGKSAVEVKDVLVDIKPIGSAWRCSIVFYLIVRIYEQIFGWRAGLTSLRRSSKPTG